MRSEPPSYLLSSHLVRSVYQNRAIQAAVPPESGELFLDLIWLKFVSFLHRF